MSDRFAVAVHAEYDDTHVHWALVNVHDGAWGCHTTGKDAKWFVSREKAESLAVMMALCPVVLETRVVTAKEWKKLKTRT